MAITLSAVSDGGKGAILTSTGGGAEWLFYKGAVAQPNCIALRSQPNYHVPIAENTTYFVVVRDRSGAELGSASAFLTVSDYSEVYNFAGGIYTSLGSEASRNSMTVTLPKTTRVNQVSLNCASGYAGTTMISTRRTGGEWKLSGIIGARPSDFTTSVGLRNSRALKTMYFSSSPKTDMDLSSALAYLKDGVALGWLTDGYTLYDFTKRDGVILSADLYGGAESYTDTKAVMDAALTLDSNRFQNGFNLLDTTISTLKSAYSNLDQTYKLKMFPLWCRKTLEFDGHKYVTEWGSLTLAEIQALNARGATIDEALAGTTLLWANEAHRTVIQKYWYFKTLDWFSSYSNLELGGFNLYSEHMVSDIEVAFTSAFKTWVENIDADFVLTSHCFQQNPYPDPWLTGTADTSKTNAHIAYVMPSITFDYFTGSTLDLRKLFLTNTLERTQTYSRGNNIELPQIGVYGVENNDADVLDFAKVIMAGTDNIGVASAPLFVYHIRLLPYYYNSATLRWAYDFLCESMLGLTHSDDLAFNYAPVTGANDVLSVAGIDEMADEVKIEWFLQNDTLNLTSVDISDYTSDLDVLLHDNLFDLDVILNIPVGLPIYIGNQQVQKVYIGNQEVTHMYLGSTQIF